MNLRKYLTSAALLLAAIPSFADADVRGNVFSKNSAEPLDFVSVAIFDRETGAPLQAGASTGEDGSFIIPQMPSGRYIVRFSNVGSVTQEREITVADSVVDMGRIDLADDTRLLAEVVVTGQRSQMSVDADRRVFNVSSSIASTGASADELLASVPSVSVSSDGEVSLRGRNDVTVWIDGKEMGMNADNRAAMLRQIPAETIESIEVMTNPSSRHSTEGTAGIINILLKKDSRSGYFGSAEADADTRGNVSLNFNVSFNKGKFETFAGAGFKSRHNPGGVTSRRSYADGYVLDSEGDIKKHENSGFLRIGASFRPDADNTLYLSAVGTLGHKWGHTYTTHLSDLPSQWAANVNRSRERGDNRGANIMLGYRHLFGTDHHIDMNVSYNIWQGSDNNRFHETETWDDGGTESVWQSQHQDVKISNWEAAIDYTCMFLPWLRFEAGYKGNYNHENSPASYASGPSADALAPVDALFNRFKYDTDISALYVNFSGHHRQLTFSAGLRGEAWQTRTRSLGAGQTDGDVPRFRKNDFSLFPSASLGWRFLPGNELKLNYSRRIRRPFGPQLNTFENISDPSEVHLGNPLIQPEYSNAAELTYIRTWSRHLLSASAYFRSNTDMISHISFLAPMASDPDVNTMYYGHANVGDMTDAGVEIISRNTLFDRLTLTTTFNLYNSHIRAWSTDYPLHGDYYPVSGGRRDRFVCDVRCMASLRLPWGLVFQASGRYSSRRLTAQGIVEPDWDVEAGLRKTLGAWSFSLVCKDIFASRKSHDILYGDGYTQSISKWSGGRALRLAVSFNFGKTGSDTSAPHNHIDTGGYGDSGHSH